MKTSGLKFAKNKKQFSSFLKIKAMKKLNLVTVLLVAFVLTATLNSNATGISEEFENYKIESVDDLYVGKNIQKIWTLTYSTDVTPVTVLKRKTAFGTSYVVRSEFFEVCYAAEPEGFGVKKIRKNWSNVPSQITNAVVNAGQMENQRIITTNKVDDEKALGLIASYLPELLNETYTHLLN